MTLVFILYQVMVENAMISEIREKRKWYYAGMYAIPSLLILIQTAEGLYGYHYDSGRCYSATSGATSYLLFFIHPTIAAVFFLIFPIIKKLAYTPENLTIGRSQVQMPRDEAKRQVILGVIVFLL